MDIENFKKIMKDKGAGDKIKTPTPQNITQECYKPSSEPKNLNAYAQKPRRSKRFKEMKRRERKKGKPVTIRFSREDLAFLKSKECLSSYVCSLVTSERLKQQSQEANEGYWRDVLAGREEISV